MVRLGFIGCGGIAHAHLAALDRLRDRAAVVAFFDGNRAQAADLAGSRKDVMVTDQVDALWDASLDAVLITVPNRYHAAYSEDAARRGLAIFCEKPLGVNVADATAMAAAVERASVVNLVGFKNRYFRAIATLRQVLDHQLLGPVFAYREVCSGARLANPHIGMEWRMVEAVAGGGAVADFGSHSIDMALWLLTAHTGPLVSLDSRLATFIARGDSYPSNDDMALLNGRFAGGALFSVLNGRVGPGLYHVEVYGLKGRALVDMTQPDVLTLVSYGGEKIAAPALPPREFEDPLVIQMARFVEAVATRTPIEPDFATALNVQRWIEIARNNAH